MNMESSSSQGAKQSLPGGVAEGASVESGSPTVESFTKIANILNTKITLPTLPKKLSGDIHLHVRLAKHREALAFLSNHEAITQGDVKLAAEVITETLAKVFENEYTGVWMLNDEGDYLKVVDEYISSVGMHEPEDEYARSEYPGWFESMMSNTHIVIKTEAEMFNLKPEFFENNQKWGIKSGLETIIFAYGEENKVVGLLQSDDTIEREFYEDEVEFHRQIANLMAAAIHNERYHLLETEINNKDKVVQAQRQVLREMMNLKSLNDGDTKTTFDFICQKLTHFYNVDGCTIWQTFDSADKLSCISSYDKTEGSLSNLRSYDINRHETPIYFDVIASGRCFAVEDVSLDMHLSELYDQQIAPSETVSVLDMGIFHYKKLVGSICIDSSVKRAWDNSDKLFLTEVAELISECILNKENKYLARQFRILSTAIEHSPCAIFAVDDNQKIQYCNANFEQLVGLTKETIMDSHLNKLRVTEDSVVDFGKMVTSICHASAWKGNIEFVDNAGNPHMMSVTAAPVYDHSVASEFVFFCE